MIEKMVILTSSSKNMYEVIYNTSNRYRNMVMNIMRMNQGDISKCSIIVEEPNANTIIFFCLFKDFEISL